MIFQDPRPGLPRRRSRRSIDQDLHPDAAAGVCTWLMRQTAIGWMIDQERKEGVNWTLRSADCVRSDDKKLQEPAMNATAFYAARIVGVPVLFGLIGLGFAAFFVLWILEFFARAGLALVESRGWRAGLSPAVAFGGGVWLAFRGVR
jgi:hypothetical protein